MTTTTITTNDHATEPTPEQLERFTLVANGYSHFATVAAAIELGVVDHLETHPGATRVEVADALGIREHSARVLLLGLAAVDLVDVENGRYRNSALSRQRLVPTDESSWRHIFASRMATDYAAYRHISESLRTGRNVGLRVHEGTGDTLYERLADRPDMTAMLHRSIAAFTSQIIPDLAGHPVLAHARHLLDVGGGSGRVAAALTAVHPDLRVTVFDLPSVVAQIAHEPEVDGPSRVAAHSGDLFADPFPTGVDSILFSHVLEVFDEERVVALLRKAHDVLEPGGRVVVYSFTARPDESGGIMAAQLSMYLNVLATGVGLAYPAPDYVRMLQEAGFGDVQVTEGLALEHSIVVGMR